MPPKYEAAYLHKFCVRRKFAGMGMTKLTTEAIRAECNKHGIRHIRPDTGLDEKMVRKIYLFEFFFRQPFIGPDTVSLLSPPSCNLTHHRNCVESLSYNAVIFWESCPTVCNAAISGAPFRLPAHLW